MFFCFYSLLLIRQIDLEITSRTTTLHILDQPRTSHSSNIMSFLTKTSIPRAAVLSATRMPIAAQRTFTASPFSQKTVTESVKEGLKKTDRVVSDNIAIPAVDAAGSYIHPSLVMPVLKSKSNVMEHIAAVRDTIKGGAKKVETGEAAGEISGKASELKGKAKGAAAEAEGKVKGAAEKAKQKL